MAEPRIERIVELQCRTATLRALQELGGEATRKPRRRPKHGGEVELIHHERLLREFSAVLAFERRRETFLVRWNGRDFTAPDHMSPDRDLCTCHVAPEHIEPLVPGVERLIVRAFETATGEAKHLDVVAEPRRDDFRRYMGEIRNVLGRCGLTAERCLRRQRAHRRATPLERTQRRGGLVRRCPRAGGRSSVSVRAAGPCPMMRSSWKSSMAG